MRNRRGFYFISILFIFAKTTTDMRKNNHFVLAAHITISIGALSAVIIGAKTNIEGLLWSGAAVLLIALVWLLTYALTEIKDQ